MYRSIPVVLEGVMQSVQRTCLVEPCEINFLREICDRPVPDLCGVPAMARVATKRNKQQSVLVKSGLQVWRNLLIKCSAERKNHGVMPFEQVVQNLFFEWGMKAAYDDLVGLADRFSPLQCQLRVVWRCFTRCEECHQLSVEQVLISG